jgi:hypothetical protein
VLWAGVLGVIGGLLGGGYAFGRRKAVGRLGVGFCGWIGVVARSAGIVAGFYFSVLLIEF